MNGSGERKVDGQRVVSPVVKQEQVGKGQFSGIGVSRTAAEMRLRLGRIFSREPPTPSTPKTKPTVETNTRPSSKQPPTPATPEDRGDRAYRAGDSADTPLTID